MTKTIYANRNYKDELFKKIFSDKKSALELYYAIRKTHYTDESAITIHTLNQVIFLGIENDISFIIDDVLNLYEHQSTINPNMPIRGLIYLGELYRDYIRLNQLDIYGRTQVSLPKPVYVVFYNGEDKQPERKEIFLSEAFKTHENSFDEEFLNLKAIMLNINYGYNQKLMELCKPLKEYSIFVDIVRKHQKNEKNSTIAAQKAVEECIKKKILLNILLREKGDIEEMIKVCYDEELHRKKEAEYNQQIGKEQGRKQGRTQGILEERENIAIRMHENGMSNQQIMTMTGLDKETLDKVLI